jgi:hypothetical protein
MGNLSRLKTARHTSPEKTMAKLLYLSRPSKRVSQVVRAWWAMRAGRRRRNATPPPPVPVITGGDFEFDATEPGMADVHIAWTIAYGTYPVASVEVWVRHGNGIEARLVTVPSSADGFDHIRATADEEWLYYRVRYVLEDSSRGVVGAFSDVFVIYVGL